MEKKRRSLPRTYTRKILRAIREFELIEPGDRVLVGFSGGKDSAFLLYALSILQEHQVIDFELAALTLDLGFFTPLDPEPLERFANSLGIKLFTMKTEIAKAAFSADNPEGPCATCSFLRRGTMNRFAKEKGFQKIALAHHHDDAVETFLMSIIYSGQIKTFLPNTLLDRTGLRVIRPLVYFRESELKKAAHFIDYQPIGKVCPVDGLTKRAEMKEYIRKLSRQHKGIFTNLAAAMREGRPQELWPAELTQEEKRRRNLGKDQ